jgi:hypothetical protein
MTRSTTLLLLSLALLLGLGPATVRGQNVTPAATPAASGTLLDVTVDRAHLPGKEGIIVLGRQTFQPGAKRTVTPPSATGAEVIVVESGALTFQIPGADGRILRGVSTGSPREERAPADTPTTLEAGDALVFPMQKHIWMNEGEVPTVMLFAAVIEPSGPPPPDPTDVGEETTEFLGQTAGAWPDLPPGPVRFTLRTERLEASELLPAPVGGIQAIGQTSGDRDVLLTADNGTLNLGQDPVDVLVVALAPLGVAEATPAAGMPGTPTMGTPSAGVSSEVLLSVTIPAEVLPTGPAYAELYRSTWAPGDQAEFPEWHPAVSVQVETVFAGDYGARSDGDIIAWRDGQFEEIAPGEEVVLGAGDAAIYLDNAANQWVRNAGTTPAEVATFIITASEDLVGPNLGIDWERSGLSGQDVAITIERQTVAPGEALPALTPTIAEPALRLVEAGELAWVFTYPNNRGATPALRFGQGAVVPFAAPVEGGQIELRNAGAELLVLVTLTLAAASDGASTPVA